MAEKAKATKLDDIKSNPLVQAAFAHFPGAQIVEVRDLLTTTEPENIDDESFDFSALDQDFDD